MKSERRHELRENDLIHALEQTREYVKRNSANLGLLIGAVLIVVVIATVTVRSRAATAEQAWRQRGELSFADVDKGRDSLASLASMVNASSDPEFARTGLTDQGVNALRLAQEVEDPPDHDFVETAAQAFEALLARFGDSPVAFAVAHDGLATVAENRFVLDAATSHKEQARTHLQAIVDNTALRGFPLHQRALERLEGLDRVFTIVRFAEAQDDEPVDEAAPGPANIQAIPISFDKVPKDLKLILEQGGSATPEESAEGSDETDEQP